MSNTHLSNINNLSSSTGYTTAAGNSTSNNRQTINANGLSQYINSVDLSNIIQSNSFLHSDLGNYINLSSPNSAASVISNNNIPNQLNSRISSNMSMNQRNNQTYFNNEHFHPHSHSHASHFNENQMLNQSEILNELNNLGANNALDQIVLNLQSNNPNEPNLNVNANEEQQQYDQQQTAEQAAANNFFVYFFKTMQSSLPFIIILIAKIFHQHLLGFFIILGFMTTLHLSNRMLVRQVELKDKKENHKLFLLILFLLLNVVVFFFIFKDYKLYNCLIFLATNIKKMDIWNLIWIVVCSDTIIKFLIISLKALITLLPFSTMPLRKRGTYYSTMETFALFYRSLTPIYPWILFIMHSEINQQILNETSPNILNLGQDLNADTKTSNSTLFPIMLCIVYSICKINQLYSRFNELVQCYKDLLRDMSYGIPVTLNEGTENICPICQDKFSRPVILKCKHTFCQDCVCVWLDKENSCPMCRAKVAIKKPVFKDGSTSIFIQWF